MDFYDTRQLPDRINSPVDDAREFRDARINLDSDGCSTYFKNPSNTEVVMLLKRSH
jgi:hypothetical protein